MSFKDKFLFKGYKEKLSPKNVALFKLVVWCVLLVWMIFFATHSVITAQILAKWAPAFFPQTPYYQLLARTLSVWYVFTVGLIIFMVAKWAYRKLLKKPREVEE